MPRPAARFCAKATAGTGFWLVLVVVLLSGAPAAAFSGSVLLVVPKSPPPGVDLKALLRGVDVYLQDFAHQVAEVDSVPDDSVGQLAQANELAARTGARFAVWYRWSGLEWSPLLSTHVAELGSAEVRLVSFAVDYPKAPGPSFYRLVGLKLRSALRAAAEPPLPAEPRVDRPPPTELPIDPGPAPEPARWAVELGPAARLPPGPFEVVASLGGAAHYEVGPWLAGAGAERSMPETRVTLAGTGETFVTRVVAVAGRRVLGEQGKPALWALAEAGVLLVHTTARLADEQEVRSHQDTVPVVSVRLLGALPVAQGLEVRAGPTLDLYPSTLRILALDTVVYSSGRVQPGLELRLRAAF
ncbi:MAG: hypothetical protein ACYC8T_15225 [Myxococcaceae bacterium]